MRTAMILGLALAAGGPAFGQARTEARTSARTGTGSDVNLPRFRAVMTSGRVYYLASYTEKPPWYVFVDMRDRKSTYQQSSVAKIEPLSQAEAERIGEAAADADGNTPLAAGDTTFGSVSVRTGARVSARTRARTSVADRIGPSWTQREAQRRKSRPAVGAGDWADFSAMSFSGSPGYTATGIPLHVGPRGGIYHYSASGNKVYHSR